MGWTKAKCDISGNEELQRERYVCAPNQARTHFRKGMRIARKLHAHSTGIKDKDTQAQALTQTHRSRWGLCLQPQSVAKAIQDNLHTLSVARATTYSTRIFLRAYIRKISIYSLAATPRSRGPRRGILPHVCRTQRRRRRLLGRQYVRAAGDGRRNGEAHTDGGDGAHGRYKIL